MLRTLCAASRYSTTHRQVLHPFLLYLVPTTRRRLVWGSMLSCDRPFYRRAGRRRVYTPDKTNNRRPCRNLAIPQSRGTVSTRSKDVPRAHKPSVAPYTSTPVIGCLDILPIGYQVSKLNVGSWRAKNAELHSPHRARSLYSRVCLVVIGCLDNPRICKDCLHVHLESWT